MLHLTPTPAPTPSSSFSHDTNHKADKPEVLLNAMSPVDELTNAIKAGTPIDDSLLNNINFQDQTILNALKGPLETRIKEIKETKDERELQKFTNILISIFDKMSVGDIEEDNSSEDRDHEKPCMSKQRFFKSVIYMLFGNGLSASSLYLLLKSAKDNIAGRKAGFGALVATAILDGMDVVRDEMSLASQMITLCVHNIPPSVIPWGIVPSSARMDNNIFQLLGMGAAFGGASFVLGGTLSYAASRIDPKKSDEEIVEGVLKLLEEDTPDGEKISAKEQLEEIKEKLEKEPPSRRKKIALIAAVMIFKLALVAFAEYVNPDDKVNKAVFGLSIMTSILSAVFEDLKKNVSIREVGSRQLFDISFSTLLNATSPGTRKHPEIETFAGVGIAIGLIVTAIILNSEKIVDAPGKAWEKIQNCRKTPEAQNNDNDGVPAV